MGKTLREKIARLSVDRQAKIQMMADEFMAEEMTLRALRGSLVRSSVTMYNCGR